MRPHFVTSAVFSLSRLSTTSATTTSRATTTTTTALKSLAATCPQQRLFSSSVLQCDLARPQAKNHQRLTVSTTTPSSASFSTTSTMATPINSKSVLELIKERRTYYALSKDLAISKDRIQEIVKDAVLHVPSSFNSQTNRVLVLFGAEHDKLWDFTSEVLKAIVPEDSWQNTANRIALFKGGAGTVLFFEDQDVVNQFQAKFPLYSDKFPLWAAQSDAMLQYVVWTALTAEGLGANLQHYNPLVDAKVAAEWGIPDNWKLNAQLVFGGRTGDAGPKEFQAIEERFKVAGA
ncbi:Nitroreductase [Hypoxylon trugodes]|uniref:Nitroreductase n=1 Tax=Hypoxylon trugodes TaxID=326681 RepID=UPI002196D60A|nr:Nitroreductase [Hypoxylon trugodes]KAI1390898.1 Nitroreductase [Hypoxylon trugodes]